MFKGNFTEISKAAASPILIHTIWTSRAESMTTLYRAPSGCCRDRYNTLQAHQSPAPLISRPGWLQAIILATKDKPNQRHFRCDWMSTGTGGGGGGEHPGDNAAWKVLSEDHYFTDAMSLRSAVYYGPAVYTPAWLAVPRPQDGSSSPATRGSEPVLRFAATWRSLSGNHCTGMNGNKHHSG